MYHDRVQRAWRFLNRSSTLLITGCYLLVVGVGMLFNHRRHARFGIDIFEHADVLHFLVAPFADVRILLFSAAAVLLTVSGYQLDLLWERRSPSSHRKWSLGASGRPWYRWLRIASFFLLLTVAADAAANRYAAWAEADVRGGGDVIVRFADNEELRGKLIGSTREILFLLDGEATRAIPLGAMVKDVRLR